MSAQALIDIIVNQKASFEVTFVVKDNGVLLDLTNYTAAAKFKTDLTASDASAIPFTTAISNTAGGEITISLTPEQTSKLNNPRYVYDVAITNTLDNYKTRIVEGVMKVSGGVT